MGTVVTRSHKKKKFRKVQTKAGLIPIIIFIGAIIAAAALVIPLSVKLEGQENTRALSQSHQ